MKKIRLFVVLNLFVAALFAGDGPPLFDKHQHTHDSLLSVMSGVFSTGKNKVIPDDVKIKIKDAQSGELIGLYKPNKNTGKYLFILVAGKTYSISYFVEGNLFKSENLIVPESTRFKKIGQKISLGILN
jgi:hypothetical protein